MQTIRYSGRYHKRRFYGCSGLPRFEILRRYGYDAFSAGDIQDAAEKLFNAHGSGSVNRLYAVLKIHGKRATLRFTHGPAYYIRLADGRQSPAA